MGRGAIAVMSELEKPASLPGEFPWIQVTNARKAMAISAANFFSRPAESRKNVLPGTLQDRCPNVTHRSFLSDIGPVTSDIH